MEELPAPGRVPRRPWGPAGAAAGCLQVCLNAVTFGWLWAVGSAGRRVHGLHSGVPLCQGAGVSGAGLSPAGRRLGSRNAPLEFQRVCSLSRRRALVTHREGRRGSCLVALRIGSLSTACVHGNRIISRQTARLPEIGHGWGHRSVRGGGSGQSDLATRSTPRARAPATLTLLPAGSRLWGR